MLMTCRVLSLRWLPLLLALAVLGCAPGKVKVTGKVLHNGKPLSVSKTGYVQVKLIPAVEPGQPYTSLPTRAADDGTFEFPAVMPGRYRIAVEQFDPTPQQDKLQGKFSEKATPLVRTINGSAPLTLDLAKPES